MQGLATLRLFTQGDISRLSVSFGSPAGVRLHVDSFYVVSGRVDQRRFVLTG